MRIFTLLLAFTAAAIAQTSAHKPARAHAPAAAAEPKGSFPLVSIAVEGNKTHKDETIIALTGLHPGMQVSKADFAAAQKKLTATGYFQSVGYSYAPGPNHAGYALTLQLVEEPQLYEVMFTDLPATDVELRAVLAKDDPLFTGRVPATDPLVKRYTQEIAEYLATAKNYHDTIVGALSPEHPPDLQLVFHPAVQPSIAEVRFVGSKTIDKAQLQAAIANVAIGSVYSEGRFRDMLDLAIKPMYEAQGRIAVSFPKITLEKAPDVKGEIATVEVQEGPVYKLRAVRAPANPELVKLASLKVGRIVNFDEVKKATERMEASYKRKGYLQPHIEVRRELDDKTQTVALEFIPHPGQQYTFGSLYIKGLDLVSEPEVRKMWGLKKGAPFVFTYPDYFLSAVREEGVFDNLGDTKSEQKIDEATHTVDVTLYFKGAGPKGKRRRGEGSDQTLQPPPVWGPYPARMSALSSPII